MFFLSFITVSFSQNCKFEKNDIDKFTGKMTKLTEKSHFFENTQVVGYMSIQKIDNNFSFILICDGSFMVRRTIKPESEIFFLLENGEKVILKEKNGVFPVTASELSELMKSKTKSFRFTLDAKNGDLQKDLEIKKGDSIRLTNLIKCVM